jgi:Flp pilus assembly protein TadD
VKSHRKLKRQLEAAMQRGVAAQQSGRLADAAKEYGWVLKKDPQQHIAVYLSAIVAYQARDYAKAIPLMQSACTRMPDFAAAYYNLGRFYQDTGKLGEAVTCFEAAIHTDPALVEAHVEMGNARMEQGDLAAALRHFDHANTLPGVTAEARYNRSFAKMVRGDWSGLADYESRWQLPLWAVEHGRFDLTAPVWDGSPLEGRKLLISTEQGFGDTLMQFRWKDHPTLRDAEVIWEVQPRLVRLLAGNTRHTVVAHGEPIPAHDVRVAMMSLPHRMGVTAETDLVVESPYIRALESVRHVLPEYGMGLRIGIRGAGSPLHRNDAKRSTQYEDWEFLLGLPGIQWIGLEARDGQDWADTASVVSQCDLVISVDTAAAHLAGAMGVPTWILLPKTPEWRWQLEREDSPWYPSARLFRQAEAGNWREVLERIGRAIVQLAATKASLAA